MILQWPCLCHGIRFSVHVPALHRLFINRAMDLPISATEPAQTVTLAQPHQSLLHLFVVQGLGVDKIGKHIARVNKGQYGCNGRWLSW